MSVDTHLSIYKWVNEIIIQNKLIDIPVYIYIESGNKNKNHSSIHLRTGKQPTWNNDLRGDEEKCKR